MINETPLRKLTLYLSSSLGTHVNIPIYLQQNNTLK